MIFFAAAVMNVRRPECEDGTLDPNFPKPGKEPDRNRVRALAGSALAVDDLTGFGLTSAAPRSL